jgi:predicted ATPase/DNA-binding winged helix-turn-helix (wHTH) protein
MSGKEAVRGPTPYASVSLEKTLTRSDPYQFGRFELRPAQRLLLADGEPARLGSRALDVLIALVERRDRVVSKSELLDVAWPNLVVEENNLAVQISALRRILGASAISSIPGRGYKFTALSSSESASSLGAGARPSQARKVFVPATVLFGRDDDVAALTNLIASYRLVTVTGAGGMGKSRLAQRVVDLERGRFLHGAVWIELAAVSDSDLIWRTISAAVGLDIRDSTPDAVLRALNPLVQLLTFDNAEHVAAEVAEVVAAILSGTQATNVLVTSQISLKLESERVYRLGPLEVPDSAIGVEEARSFGAVALFEDRAKAVDRRFTLSEQNVPSVIDVCRQLDGVPLAIELAAARVQLLGSKPLTDALRDRLRLLISGDRFAPRRQQTLRAALEWSHGLLGPVEQVVFRRLGVFASSFSVSPAQLVVVHAGDEGIDEWVFLDALGTLIEHSLVETDSADEPRYRLLESMRAFAVERLTESGELDECGRRHAIAVRDQFKKVERDRWDGRLSMDEAYELLEPDLENARKAFRWALEHDRLLAVEVWSYTSYGFHRASFLDQKFEWEATAEIVGYSADPVKAIWHRRYALYCGNKKLDVAVKSIRRAIEIHTESHDDSELFKDLAVLCYLRTVGPGDEKFVALAKMRELAGANCGIPARFALAHAEGLALLDVHDWAGAIAALRRATSFADRGNAIGLARIRLAICGAQLALGQVEQGLQEAITIERELAGTHYLLVLEYARLHLIGAWLAKNDVARARAVGVSTWPLVRQVGMEEDWIDLLALLAALENRPRAAAKLLGYSDALLRKKNGRRGTLHEVAAERARRIASEALPESEVTLLRRAGTNLTVEVLGGIGLAQSDECIERRTY